MTLLISISGIRGIVGSELNHQNTMQFTTALINTCAIKRLIVARDTRASGLYLRDIVCGTALALGTDVIDLGVVPTPTAAMAVKQHKADGAILITASHNPIQWNALKFLDNQGECISQETLNSIKIAQKSEMKAMSYQQIGQYKTDHYAIKKHIESIISLPYISPESIEKTDFKVAYNSINGTGAYAIPQLLKSLGIKNIISVYCQPDGTFPHNPEPIGENISYFTQTVIKNQCDIGFITDPDSDRLAIITNKGQLFGEENTQVLATDFILNHKQGNMVTNISSSLIIDHIAKKYNQKVLRTSVGERNIIEKMKQSKAIIGGEGNGGVINPDLHYGRDALVAIAMILQWLSTSNCTIDDYLNILPKRHIIKNQLAIPKNRPKQEYLLQTLKKAFPMAVISNLDGIHIRFDELSWLLIRLSNTEPIIRIVTEGPDKYIINKHIEYVRSLIQKK